MSRVLKIHGVYRHFKGGLYIVEDVIYHSETKKKWLLTAHYKKTINCGVDHIVCFLAKLTIINTLTQTKNIALNYKKTEKTMIREVLISPDKMLWNKSRKLKPQEIVTNTIKNLTIDLRETILSGKYGIELKVF